MDHTSHLVSARGSLTKADLGSRQYGFLESFRHTELSHIFVKKNSHQVTGSGVTLVFYVMKLKGGLFCLLYAKKSILFH